MFVPEASMMKQSGRKLSVVTLSLADRAEVGGQQHNQEEEERKKTRKKRRKIRKT